DCPSFNCTTFQLQGTDACHVKCVASGSITQCKATKDGCCPAGCNANPVHPSFDGDCMQVCGNGVVEGMETCDGDCAAQLADCKNDQDHVGTPTGMVSNCTFVCKD